MYCKILHTCTRNSFILNLIFWIWTKSKNIGGIMYIHGIYCGIFRGFTIDRILFLHLGKSFHNIFPPQSPHVGTIIHNWMEPNFKWRPCDQPNKDQSGPDMISGLRKIIGRHISHAEHFYWQLGHNQVEMECKSGPHLPPIGAR